MSEHNSHYDTTMNLWRVSEEQVIELIKEYPNGRMHPNCICYVIKLPTFRLGGHIKVKYFIEGSEQEWFKELVKDCDAGVEFEGNYLLKKMTESSLPSRPLNLFEGEEE